MLVSTDTGAKRFSHIQNWMQRSDKLNIEDNAPLELDRTINWPFLLLTNDTTSTARPYYFPSLYQTALETSQIGKTTFRIYGRQISDWGLTHPFPIKLQDTLAFSTLWPEIEGFFIGYPGNTKMSPVELPEYLVIRLEQLSQLPEKWDSYSASRISKAAIDEAKVILLQIKLRCSSRMFQNTFIAPCSDGGIQLELKSETNKELIIKISESGHIGDYLYSEPSGKQKEGTITEQNQWSPVIGLICETRKGLR
jgi:hypothetical protein